MGIIDILNRLNNTNSFFIELGNKFCSDIDLTELKSMSLNEIEKVFSQINDKSTKQVFANEISEKIALNIRELQELIPERITILEDFEIRLKDDKLKGFYNSTKIDLTHTEQMLLISYLQDAKMFPNVADYGNNKGFFILISTLLNRTEKNSEKYLYDKSIKKNLQSLEKIQELFKKAKFKELEQRVENDIIKLK
ncbi:hypothetical protein [Empedobacter brevis]|uniref:hypothetical protein n=1 Tax=Empedobacter brevis TaxID=247 RepID=UPI00333EAB7B